MRQTVSYKVKRYQDGQLSANIIGTGDLEVTLRGHSYEELFEAATIKEAWDAMHRTNKNAVATLRLTCLIGQRSDRRFETNASFNLKVIANFINSMGFDTVQILHPHSSVSLALIERSEAWDYFEYVEATYKAIGAPTLVSPDAGAYKTTYTIAETLGADLVPANKVRVNGLPEIKIQGDVAGKTCLIVDDLADGGRTTKFLAEALKASGATKVYLYVTHGQFNFGFEELKQSIDHIYCTNSFRDITDAFVTQYKII